MKHLILASLFLYLPAFAGDFKYVDTRAVFSGTDEGKKVLEALQKDYQSKQDDIKLKVKILEGKAAEYQAAKGTMTKESREEQERLLSEKYNELNSLSDKYWKEFAKQRDEAFDNFKKKFADVIKDLVVAKKLDFVLDKEVFVYYPVKMDMTEEVVKAYNKKYPLGGKQ